MELDQVIERIPVSQQESGYRWAEASLLLGVALGG